MTVRINCASYRAGVASTLACIALLLGSAVSADAADKLNVVVSTSLLECAVKEIGGARVEVTAFIAPGSCPGHHDVSPQDLRKLSSSKLALTHDFEGFLDNIVRSMSGSKPTLVKVKVPGSWLVAEVYIRGAEQVTSALCSVDARNSSAYKKSLTSLKSRARKLAAALQNDCRAAGVSGAAVLCSNQQTEFVKWMGFRVVGSYARAEEFTPARLHKMTTDARRYKVRVVIDNLQSGPTAGRELAKDVGARHVTLSNFPGGFAGTDTWSKCVRDNANRLLRSIGKK